jgi:putative intracellular protease/amidase
VRAVVLYATDTMADAEYGPVVDGVALGGRLGPGGYRVVTASDGAQELVTTLGGLRLRPETTLAELDPDEIALLVLSGAATWHRGHQAVLGLVQQLLERGTPVAAIGAAALGLARTGVLNERRHTADTPQLLAGAHAYTGADRWEGARTVEDGDVITAPGSAPVAFARAVLARLHLLPPSALEAWYGLHTTGDREFRDRLTAFEQQRST